MKTALLTIALAIGSLTLSAQSIVLDASTNKFQAQTVQELGNDLSKDELFAKAQQWIALNYKSGQDVIQSADKENGKIICKGNFPTNLFMKKGWIEHTMILDFKDGRVRCTFTDFVYTSPGSGALKFESKNMGGKKKALAETEEHIKTAMANLSNYLSSTKEESNW